MEGNQEGLGRCLKVFPKFVHDCCLKAPQKMKEAVDSGFLFVCFQFEAFFFKLVFSMLQQPGYFMFQTLCVCVVCVCVVLLQEIIYFLCNWTNSYMETESTKSKLVLTIYQELYDQNYYILKKVRKRCYSSWPALHLSMNGYGFLLHTQKVHFAERGVQVLTSLLSPWQTAST